MDSPDRDPLYAAVRDEILFRLPAETAHELAMQGLRAGQGTFRLPVVGDAIADAATATFSYDDTDDRLSRDIDGMPVDNPVGLAPGFDKSARAVPALSALGFGFLEVGGVTAAPQRGNAPEPSDGRRLARVPGDRALLNSMGFNNDGAARVGDRLAFHDETYDHLRPVGVNLGEHNLDHGEEHSYPEEIRRTIDRLDDRLGGDGPAYMTVNVSCPNTAEGRVQSDRDAVRDAVDAADRALAATAWDPAVYLKIGPPEAAADGRDALDHAIADLLDAAGDRVDGFVAINTAGVQVSDYLDDADRFWTDEAGLSGDPLYDIMCATVDALARRSDDATVIASGGISTGEDAYGAIRHGADMVQLYTGLVYRGPFTAARINEELDAVLAADGYDHVDGAVGTALD